MIPAPKIEFAIYHQLNHKEKWGRTLAIPSRRVPLNSELGPSASHNSLSSSLDVALPPLITESRGAEAECSSSSSGALNTISSASHQAYSDIHRLLSPEPCSPLRRIWSPEGVLLPDPSPCRSTSSEILTLRALSKEVRLEVGRDGPALTVMDGRSGNASDDATRDMLVE
jgi:hypothetical protein